MKNSTDSNTSTAHVDNGKSDNLGVFFPYTPGTVNDIAGTRTVSCCYKQTAAMKAKGIDARSNEYLRIPTDHLTEAVVVERIADLASAVVDWLRSVEDDTIKQYHKDGGQKVYVETLSLEKILATLEERGQGGSLDSEVITAWFTDAIVPSVSQTLASKLGEDKEASDKIKMVLKGYLEQFVSLASGKTKMAAPQRARLARAIEVAEAEETVIGTKILARFKRMEEQEAEQLDALGIDL